MSMNFPLFDDKDLKDRPALQHESKRDEASGGSCPPEKSGPFSYLRDLVMIAVVAVLLAGIVWVAYRLPKWL